MIRTPRAFLETPHAKIPKRPPTERVRDWDEVETRAAPDIARSQAGRCMSCGVPFCQSRCPLGNDIPDWNDLVTGGRWHEAWKALERTNPFPEFTGFLCPAPCENACVESIHGEAIGIKGVERAIAERAFDEGWVRARAPVRRTGKTVAVVGSGPAGLAVADALNARGHSVTVFEKAPRPGGLLRYGIPSFKMDKARLDARIALLQEAGIGFECSAAVTSARAPSPAEAGNGIPLESLLARHDATILCLGAQRARTLTVDGAGLEGVVFAMEFLRAQDRARETGGRSPPLFDARGKHVVIIGGGDTGSDCLGTALRQGARSVVQIDVHPEAPRTRAPSNPWPQWARIHRSSSSHEEGGVREFALSTARFLGSGGRVVGLEAEEVPVAAGAEAGAGARGAPRGEGGREARVFPCDLGVVAIGFEGVERSGLAADVPFRYGPRGTVDVDASGMTSHPGLFAAGDAVRGQSLIVWALAEGVRIAGNVDAWLRG